MNTKRCARCGRNFPYTSFYKSSKSKDSLGSWCEECIRIYNRERYRTMRKTIKAGMDPIKIKAIDILGGPKCVSCGYSKDIRALHIDHINGGGKIRGKDLYRNIIKIGSISKEIYQVLCANCNWIKRYEKREFRRF